MVIQQVLGERSYSINDVGITEQPSVRKQKQKLDAYFTS